MKEEKGSLFLRCFVLFLLLLLVSLISLVSGVQSAVINVQPASLEVSHGDTFTIEIKIDPEGSEIYGAQYTLYFNPGLLNATSQTQGTFLSHDGASTSVILNRINNSLGKIEYGESRMGVEYGVTEPGVLASITFDVTGTSGTSDLKLSDVMLCDINGTEIEVITNNGICSITGPEPAATPAPTYNDITVEEAHEMQAEKPEQIILLDVRTEAEYDAEHIPDAKLIPLPELENRIGELDKDKIIIVYCKTGGRSRQASEILVQHGFEHVYNMLGGIEAWRINYPVYKPTPTPAPEQTPPITPPPSLSPTPAVSPSPVISTSPSPSIPSPTPAHTPTPTPASAGFEVVFAIIGLLTTSFLISKSKRKRR